MKLLLFELKKLFGVRYLWLSLLFAVIICSAVFYVANKDAAALSSSGDDEVDAAVRDIIYKYGDDRASLDIVWDGYIAHSEMIRDEQKRFYDALVEGGADEKDAYERAEQYASTLPEYENKLGYYYSDGEPMSDYDLLAGYYGSWTDSAGYEAYLDGVLLRIEQNLHRIEVRDGGDTPAAEYQYRFRDLFERAHANIDISGIRPSECWERFFAFDMMSVFVYVYLTLASGAVFLHERSCGTLTILRSTKSGRLKTSLSKLAALMILDVFAVAVFTLATFAVGTAMFGFSTPSMPIQSVGVETYWNCPYIMTIGEFMLALFAVRCLLAISFSFIAALATVIAYSPILTYAVAGAALLLSLIVNYFVTFDAAVRLNYIGLASSSAIGQYSEILTLGHYSSTLLTGVSLFAAVLVAAAAVTAIFSTVRGAGRVTDKGIGKVLIPRFMHRSEKSQAGKSSASTRGGCMTTSLFLWECRKLLTLPTVLLVAVLLLVHAYTSYRYYTKADITASKKYDDYITENWFGPLTDGKEQRFYERYGYIADIVSVDNANNAVTQLQSGDMTGEEYEAFVDEYRSLKTESNLIDRLEGTVQYLAKQKRATGIEGWIIKTGDIARLLGRGVDIWLAAAIIFIFCRMHTPDYTGKSSEGNFAAVMRTTKRGRRIAYRAKMLAAVAVALTLSVLFEAVDLALGIAHTDGYFDVLSAPLMSISRYSSFGAISVGAYHALVIATRILAAVTLAYISCAASYLTKKLHAALIISAAVTFLPYALVYMGLDALRYTDFTAALAGGELWTRSAELAIGGTYTFGMMLLFVYGAVAAAASLAVRAKVGK